MLDHSTNLMVNNDINDELTQEAMNELKDAIDKGKVAQKILDSIKSKGYFEGTFEGTSNDYEFRRLKTIPRIRIPSFEDLNFELKSTKKMDTFDLIFSGTKLTDQFVKFSEQAGTININKNGIKFKYGSSVKVYQNKAKNSEKSYEFLARHFARHIVNVWDGRNWKEYDDFFIDCNPECYEKNTDRVDIYLTTVKYLLSEGVVEKFSNDIYQNAKVASVMYA